MENECKMYKRIFELYDMYIVLKALKALRCYDIAAY